MDAQLENHSESVEVVKKEGRKKVIPEYPIIKVQLPREAAIKVQEILVSLKERRAETKVDEILSDYLNSISDSYLKEQLELRTPEEYYFEAARNIPELREKIILQARKALQRGDHSNTSQKVQPLKRAKKSRKFEQATEMSEATLINAE